MLQLESRRRSTAPPSGLSVPSTSSESLAELMKVLKCTGLREVRKMSDWLAIEDHITGSPLFPRTNASPYELVKTPLTYSSVCSSAMFM